ncbi:Transmembrane amino acid transporter family protein [Raphanus sativus]|nr:Transmembrane amino acid transporter family protein [Raphanus sativus]
MEDSFGRPGRIALQLAVLVNVDGLFFPTAPSLTTSNLRFASITAALIAVIFVGANFIPNIWLLSKSLELQLLSASVSYSLLRSSLRIVITKIVVAVFSNAVAMYSAFVRKNQSIFPI